MPQEFTPVDRGHAFRKVFFQIVYGPLVLTISILLGGIVLYAFISAPFGSDAPVAFRQQASDLHATPAITPAPTIVALRAVKTPVRASNPYGMLFDPSFTANLDPGALDQNLPLRSSFASPLAPPISALADSDDVEVAPLPVAPKLAQEIPLPARRPQELNEVPPPRPSLRQMAQSKAAAAPAPQADNRSLFDKLFGLSGSPGPLLAYAAPEDGAIRNSRMVPSRQTLPYDHWTAVYDITARTVYLPDGTKLEAHSGLGDRLDDPRHVNERMRGATPPHVYELQLREQLFHGVQALRLTPIGEGDVYGRTGLLAHRYMLGPNGDSNGCVSIKDYQAFLQAYRNGEIKRLAVVARLN
jgi:hypothetical protein